MAIDDIVARIAADAEEEARTLTDAAEAEADRVRADARARSDARAKADLARGTSGAQREAATIVANARLAARDALLTARQAMDAEALAAVVGIVAALPDDRYAALLVRGIVEAAEGCSALRIGSADASRLRTALPKALQAAGVKLTVEDAPADVERGVVLVGDRVRVEVSPTAIVAARRDDLLADVDSALFGTGG